MESSRWKTRPPSCRGRKRIHIQAPPEKAVGFPITPHPATCCLPQLGWMHHISYPSNTFRNSPVPCFILTKHPRPCQIRYWLRMWALEPNCLGLNPSFATGCMCDLAQLVIVTSTLQIDVVWMKNSTGVYAFWGSFAIQSQILWFSSLQKGPTNILYFPLSVGYSQWLASKEWTMAEVIVYDFRVEVTQGTVVSSLLSLRVHPLWKLAATLWGHSHSPVEWSLWRGTEACSQQPGEFSSIQFSHSVVSDSLQPHGLQRARLPCPSPTPRTCSNSCPSSQWCHPSISSSVVPFSCLQSFSASG